MLRVFQANLGFRVPIQKESLMYLDFKPLGKVFLDYRFYL